MLGLFSRDKRDQPFDLPMKLARVGQECHEITPDGQKILLCSSVQFREFVNDAAYLFRPGRMGRSEQGCCLQDAKSGSQLGKQIQRHSRTTSGAK
jgi:hypothetical protein